MTRLIVEAGFGSTMTTASPTWTEITKFVDMVQGIRIERGASDELQDIQAGTCTMVLNDEDGRFTSGLATGAYFPNIKKNVPIRVRSISTDQNLVTNPSFESGLTGWSPTASPTIAQDATHVKQGSQAMRITWGAPVGQSAFTEIYGLDIGTRYTASAYVWVPTGAPALETHIEGISLGTPSAVNDTWTRITYSFVATDTHHRLVIQTVGTPTAGTQCWVDAVQLWEGPSALPLNHLANGDFESNVSNWASSGTPTVARSTTRAQRGASSMLVTWGGVDNQSVTSDAMTGLIVGQTYTFSAYVWVPSGDAPVRLTVAGGNLGNPSTLFDQWERISVTWTATATSHQVRIRHNVIPTAGDQVWMDAAMVAEGSTPAEFTTLDGAQIHARFYGMVNAWPTQWKGLYAIAPITCTDVFKTLERQETLQPMLVEEVLLDDPTVYYPLTESADSASAGDLSGTAGVGSLSIAQAGSGGTLDFAAGTGPTGLPCPVFSPASSTAGKYLSGDLGQSFTDANASSRVRAECWFSTSATDRVLLALTSSDAQTKMIISLESGTGKIQVQNQNPGSSLVSTVWATPNLADGALHYLLYNEFTGEVTVDGTTYTTSNFNPADLRLLYVGGFQNARLWNGTISQLALYVRSVTTAALTPHYTTGTTEHIGESASTRMQRIASYVPIDVFVYGSTFDGMASQAALGSSPLTHMKDIENTESGKLIADRSSNGLVFQSRDVRYNATTSVTIDFADLDTDQLEYADDDQKMTNTVIASRPGGATQRVVDKTARATYGPYEKPLDLLKSSDLKVADAANWLVSRYADPPTEIRQVPVDAYTLPVVTYRALLEAGVSTVIGLTGLPDEAPAPTASVTVEGYTETITRNRHQLDFHTSRTQSDNVWVLDDPSLSVLGTTTRLAY